MENQCNIISSQGNQDNISKHLDSDLTNDNQYKTRKHQLEKKHGLVSQHIGGLKNLNINDKQKTNTIVVKDDFARVKLADNNDVIDYEDKEDDDLVPG